MALIGPRLLTPLTSVLVCALLAAGHPASAQDLEPLGAYHNVRSADGGEHCSGYSLSLWRRGTDVFGLLDVHEGLCGDPPCGVIERVGMDDGTARLRFEASIDRRRIAFDGTRTEEALEGVLGDERVRLARDPSGSDVRDPANRSVAAWCGRWRAIPRCQGVVELCTALEGRQPRRD